MSREAYVVLGYAVAVVVLWGYALCLYLEHRRLSRIEQMEERL